MPRNYFAGWTLDELLAERRAVQERISGGAITETGAASVRTSIKHEASAEQTLTRIEYALFLADPDNYSNPYSSSITRTRPSFFTLGEEVV